MLVIVKRVHAGYVKHSVYYGWIINIILTQWVWVALSKENVCDPRSTIMDFLS